MMSRNNDVRSKPYRPSNNPSKNLSQCEIQYLYDILGNDCVTLTTAIAQVLHGYDNAWHKQASGVLCFVKDYSKRNYYFRLYDLELKKSIFEEPVSSSIRLQKLTDIFYVFDAMNFKVGFNFIDQVESEMFCNQFHTKQESRQNKKNSKQQPAIQPIPTPSNENFVMSQPVSNINKSSTKQANSKDKKSKDGRPLIISSPVSDSLVHVIHIGSNDGFVADDTHRKLFNQVLSTMKLSPEEKLYVEHSVANTKDGLKQLFEPIKHDYDIICSDVLNVPPQVTISAVKQSDTTTKRSPIQDLSMPKIIFERASITYSQTLNSYENVIVLEQSQKQIASTRPSANISHKVEVSSQILPPPLPPKPAGMHILQPRSNSLIPPPPPPLPVFESKPIKSDMPVPPSNPSYDALLQEIHDSHENNRNQQLHTSKVTLVKKSNIEVQRTLEENILEMIRVRRLLLMGRESNADDENTYKNDSDDDDDQW